MNARLRIDRRDQLEAEPERAAAARSLNTRNLVVIGKVAEENRTDQLGKTLVACTPEVGLGLLGLEQDALGILDHREDGSATDTVAKDADADVDFLRPRISVAERNQLKERVALNR